MPIVWWILIGFLAGAIARFLVPGRDHMGLVGTTALGLVGSLIGGLLGQLLQPARHALTFTRAGLFGSVVGAVIALVVYRAVTRRRGVLGRRGFMR
jgi:uncharacterized membrane protein YeaQ/YmgE (transglycosylase-associated protein family)